MPSIQQLFDSVRLADASCIRFDSAAQWLSLSVIIDLGDGHKRVRRTLAEHTFITAPSGGFAGTLFKSTEGPSSGSVAMHRYVYG